MFALPRHTIAACTVAVFAVASAAFSIGAQASPPGKSQARIAAEIESPVSAKTLASINPSSQDGCITINERKIHADGSADVKSFRVCE